MPSGLEEVHSQLLFAFWQKMVLSTVVIKVTQGLQYWKEEGCYVGFLSQINQNLFFSGSSLSQHQIFADQH